MCAAIFKHGVDYTIVRWIRATLEDRLAAATLSGFSKRVAVSRGCPQGGVLSPLLWCLVDDLITRLNGGGMCTHGYADDICLLAVGNFPNTVSGLIHCALLTVEMWCDEVGLSVNLDKTEFVVFTRRRKLPGFFEPQFFWLLYVALCRSSISGSPKFSPDLEGASGFQSKEGSTFVVSLRRAYGSTWGLGPKMIHSLYFSVIRPSITFVSLI